MEQNKKPRDKSTHIWHTSSLIKEARIYNGEKTISLTSGARKTGQSLVTDWNRTLSNTTHKNKLKNGLKI